jgi:uncharacterized membrane protein YqgA involved in biofilm formation
MTWIKKVNPAYFYLFLSAIALGAIIGCVTHDPNWLPGVGITGMSVFILLVGLYWFCSKFGAPRLVAWAVAIGFIIRLAVGIGLQVGLPLVGQPTEQQQAGYVFQDAYLRDTQAQNLAASDKPISTVFTKGYATDQYGGYLALSIFVYRYLSPDSARPALMILLSAWVGGLGILFFWLILQKLAANRVVGMALWLFCLYPQNVLLGATQMREPYLILLSCILIWSVLDWFESSRKKMLLWSFLAVGGILLISPGILLPLFVSLAGWWMFSPRRRRLPVWAVAAVIAALVLVIVVFAYAVASQTQLERYSLPQIILKWFSLAIEVDMELSMANSGRIEYLFQGLPTWFQPPFILLYGVLQPVLPAALLDKTLWISNLISSFLAAGWYWLLPLLVYAPFIRTNPVQNGSKGQFRWIILVCWFWILFCSLRAGGDQWDNPRYRTILLPWLVLAAAWVWDCARQNKFYWLKHIWLAESVF